MSTWNGEILQTPVLQVLLGEQMNDETLASRGYECAKSSALKLINRFVGRTLHSEFSWFGFGKRKVLLAHDEPENTETQCSTVSATCEFKIGQELVFGEMQFGTLTSKARKPLKVWHEPSQGATSVVPLQPMTLNPVIEAASAGAAAVAARIRARNFIFRCVGGRN